MIGVLASGVLNALLITGFPTLTTHWGQLLLLKAIPVMIMVVIALANRYVLVPRMRQDEDRAAPGFVWMTKLEWAIGAVVLGSSACLRLSNLLMDYENDEKKVFWRFCYSPVLQLRWRHRR